MIEKPFHGIASFLKSPIGNRSRSIGVFGIPFDGATSYAPGTRFGPNAIRKSSMMLTDGAHPLFETYPQHHVTDLGDIVTGMSVDGTLAEIERVLGNHEFLGDGKPLLFMGGDHTVSLGILRSISRRYHHTDPDGPVVIHFDAHCDTWADHFGEPRGHGTWVRNIVEEGHVRADRIISIGLRSPVDPVTRDWLATAGGTSISARQAMNRLGVTALASLIREKIGDSKFYISFDIDALDPAYAPGTGTPEIAGLTPHFVLDLLDELADVFDPRFVGMDVVEVNPTNDPSGITALAAANLLWHVAAAVSRDFA